MACVGAPARPEPPVSRERLGFSPPAGDGRTGHSAGTRIAEVRGLCTAASVGEGDAHDGAFPFLDLGATLVANEHGLSGHISSNRGNHAR